MKMASCEIYHVPYKGSFRWKWRSVQADGRVIESENAYALYYECVCAAREQGYQPNGAGGKALADAKPRG
jgi:hypothetical protein